MWIVISHPVTTIELHQQQGYLTASAVKQTTMVHNILTIIKARNESEVSLK